MCTASEIVFRLCVLLAAILVCDAFAVVAGAEQGAPPSTKRNSDSLQSPSERTVNGVAGKATPDAQPLALPRPLQAVVVSAEDATAEKIVDWARTGHQAVVVVLDENTLAEKYESVAKLVKESKLDLYYWIEVARNKALADAHPRWMASLGMHGDWRKRFPDAVALKPNDEVAKAYPWVPIGYREAFDAHAQRIQGLVRRAAGDYRGILLNDLQGGPASCGCGNVQCRWALDYRVPATATPIAGADVAVQFLAEVRKLAPGKEIIPVWMTECEKVDLPSNQRSGAPTTGLCGGVPCATGSCPKAFAQQWSALTSNSDSPVGLLVLQKELERNGPAYASSSWIPQAVDYVDTVSAQHNIQAVPHDRLWLVVQGYDVSEMELAAAREDALRTRPGAVLVALTRMDQSYQPRVIRAR